MALLEQLKVMKDKIERIFSLKSSKACPNARLLSSVYFEYLMIQCYVWCICPFPDISDCCHYLSYATFPPGATKREWVWQKMFLSSISNPDIKDIIYICSIAMYHITTRLGWVYWNFLIKIFQNIFLFYVISGCWYLLYCVSLTAQFPVVSVLGSEVEWEPSPTTQFTIFRNLMHYQSQPQTENVRAHKYGAFEAYINN